MQIRKNLVSKDIASKVTYNGKNPIKKIVVHETDNTDKGANADAHSRLQANGNSRQASWHYQVDDKEVVQSFSDDVQCWHAGNDVYNKESIGVEICVNSDGDFLKAVENAIELVSFLMEKHGISKQNVVQHHTASGKNCPRNLRSGAKGIKWAEFKDKLGGNTNTSKPDKKPVEPPKTDNKPNKKSFNQMVEEVRKGLHGNGHENRRKSLGISVAEYNKVKDEVNKREAEKNKQPDKPKKTISQMADEVEAGKHGKGHANRQKSLGINKTEYEKVRAEVNKRAGVANKPAPKPKKLKAGDKVTIKSTARFYATGQVIPTKYRGKSFTVQQVGTSKVLIKELYSWVKTSDLQ